MSPIGAYYSKASSSAFLVNDDFGTFDAVFDGFGVIASLYFFTDFYSSLTSLIFLILLVGFSIFENISLRDLDWFYGTASVTGFSFSNLLSISSGLMVLSISSVSIIVISFSISCSIFVFPFVGEKSKFNFSTRSTWDCLRISSSDYSLIFSGVSSKFGIFISTFGLKTSFTGAAGI